jgi:hypothetical protein
MRNRENHMPLPLIPIAAGAAALAIVGALAVPRIMKTLSGKNVAVLGGRSVGKTTLLYLLQHRKLPETSDEPAEGDAVGEFEIVMGRGHARFTLHKDITEHPGAGGYKIWRDAFSKADHVWYLFRADLIAQGDPLEVSKVKGHLDLFAAWLGNRSSGSPRVMLIGTWADQDSRYKEDATSFKESLARSSPLQVGMVKLEHSALIVGSLEGKKEADKLLQKIGRALQGK